MTTLRIFLASSSELADDRREFRLFISTKNDDWVARGVYLQLVTWEDFLDGMSKTRLQDEYNKAILECDIFVMLFFTKVGRYTAEEFETAFGQFKATNKPFILTYFKDAQISSGSADRDDLQSLWAFQDKLQGLGHFKTVYKTIADLKLHFSGQLDKLAAKGFIEFDRSDEGAGEAGGTRYEAKLEGSGAIAQGPNARAVGAGGVMVGGDNEGNLNTGKQEIDTGGGAFVGGNVKVKNGDFVGRDKVRHGKFKGD